MAEKADRFQVAQAERFRPYPQYRDSGLDWLGEIPAHWEVKKWRYCCHVTERQIAPDDEQFRERVLIAPNHIESGTGRLLRLETAREQGAISGKYLVGPGDIVYSKIRPALNKVCIATGDWLCSADMYPVSITESRLQTKFLLYFMLSAPYVQLMVDQSMRVAMPKVNRDKLAACPLLVPDPAEQRAIADFLDRETAKIDALVAKKMRLIELLQEKRTALITRAVTRGLDPNVPMKDSGVEWLGEIPAHWEAKRLKNLTPGTTVGIVVTPSKYYVDEGIPCLRSLNVSRGAIDMENLVFISEHANALHRKSKIFAGDVVVVRTGQAGVAAVVPKELDGANCIDLLIVRCSEQILSQFVYYYLNSRNAISQAAELSVGAIQAHYNTSTLARLVVPEIPTDEQGRIVAYLDAATREIDRLIGKVRQAIDHLGDFRSALICAAVTGKIDVREAAPR